MMAVRQNSEECTKIPRKNKNCSYNLMLTYQKINLLPTIQQYAHGQENRIANTFNTKLNYNDQKNADIDKEQVT